MFAVGKVFIRLTFLDEQDQEVWTAAQVYSEAQILRVVL